MKKTVLISLAILALLLASCTGGPTQAQYDTAMKNLGKAESRVSDLEAENAKLSATLEKTRSDLIASEARAAELSAKLSVGGAGGTAVGGSGSPTTGSESVPAGTAICAQTWDMISNPDLLLSDISDKMLTADAVQMGYSVYLTQYQVGSGETAKFQEDLPFYVLLVNPGLPGIVMDISQGCVILAPAEQTAEQQ